MSQRPVSSPGRVPRSGSRRSACARCAGRRTARTSSISDQPLHGARLSAQAQRGNVLQARASRASPSTTSARRLSPLARAAAARIRSRRVRAARPVGLRERERGRDVVLDRRAGSAPPRAGAACRRAAAPRQSGRQAPRRCSANVASPDPAALLRQRQAQQQRVVLGRCPPARDRVARARLVEQEIGIRGKQVGVARIERQRRAKVRSAAAASPRRAAISAASVSAHARTPAASLARASACIRPRYALPHRRSGSRAAASHVAVTRPEASRSSFAQSRCASA